VEMYEDQVGTVGSAGMARIALLIDAAYVRCCAAREREQLTGLRISANRVNLDAAGICRWLGEFVVDFGLLGPGDSWEARPSPRIYDGRREDRRQRFRQPHYGSVLKAQGFVVRTARAGATNGTLERRGVESAVPGAALASQVEPFTMTDRFDDDRICMSGAEAALAGDLVRLAGCGEVDMVLLLGGAEVYAGPVVDACRLGAEIVLIVAPGSPTQVAGPLRAALARSIVLHPEVFELFYDVAGSTRGS
jgi:hypothetical protein